MPELPPNSSLILYQTPDGQTRLECRFDQETFWLTRQMAELFQTSVPNLANCRPQVPNSGPQRAGWAEVL